jgi:hypothetical protein
VPPAPAAPHARADDESAAIETRLLDELPERRRPPATVPPLRRPEVRARLGMPPFDGDGADHDHPHDHDGHAHDRADGHAHDHMHA